MHQYTVRAKCRIEHATTCNYLFLSDLVAPDGRQNPLICANFAGFH